MFTREVISINTIGDRIKEIRKAAGKTQQSFADVIGLKRNTIANYEIGQIQPSDRTIADICREFNISEHWLRTGEGEMRIKLSEDADFIRVMTEIQVSDDAFIKSLLKSYWDLNKEEKAAIHKLVDGMLQNKKTEE